MERFNGNKLSRQKRKRYFLAAEAIRRRKRSETETRCNCNSNVIALILHRQRTSYRCMPRHYPESSYRRLADCINGFTFAKENHKRWTIFYLISHCCYSCIMRSDQILLRSFFYVRLPLVYFVFTVHQSFTNLGIEFIPRLFYVKKLDDCLQLCIYIRRTCEGKSSALQRYNATLINLYDGVTYTNVLDQRYTTPKCNKRRLI